MGGRRADLLQGAVLAQQEVVDLPLHPVRGVEALLHARARPARAQGRRRGRRASASSGCI